MIARIETDLALSADSAWRTLLRCDTFLYITRGLLGFAGSPAWPERFEQGATIETRLRFFHVLPAWRHTLHVKSVDGARRELKSEEFGGPVGRWNHRIAIAPLGDATCRYTDEIDMDAGVLTPFVWVYAHLFYRYRQMRWRRLVGRTRS